MYKEFVRIAVSRLIFTTYYSLLNDFYTKLLFAYSGYFLRSVIFWSVNNCKLYLVSNLCICIYIYMYICACIHLEVLCDYKFCGFSQIVKVCKNWITSKLFDVQYMYVNCDTYMVMQIVLPSSFLYGLIFQVIKIDNLISYYI
jgi:hypothetical protein